MRALFLDGMFIPASLEPLYGGKGSFDIINEKIKTLTGDRGFDRLIVLQNGSLEKVPEGFKNVVLSDLKPYIILKTLYDEAKNCDELVVFDAGNPFFDTAYFSEMTERHNNFLADYTYALGFPAGLTPQIIRKDILKEMMVLVQDEEDEHKDYLFYALSKDINSFDIETFLSPVDLRIARIKTGANDQGEIEFTKKLFEKKGADSTYGELAAHINDHQEMLYTLPYMLTIELTGKQNLNSIYLPDYPQLGGEKAVFLEMTVLDKILNELKTINTACKIVFGGLGEPLLHPDFTALAEKVTSAGFELIVETNGLLIDNNLVSEVNKLNTDLITFVVTCDALREEVYKAIHDNGDFLKLQKALALLEENDLTYYRQIVRMEKNEEDIETIIRNKDSKNLILRKFSTYCGKLEDKKVVDLAPLERIPCFHLRREIFLRSDAEYCYCKYSFDKTIGNAGTNELETVIKKMESAYIDNARDNLLDFCKMCDEYYLFNF